MSPKIIELSEKMAISILLYDHVQLSNLIVQKPEEYGFKELHTAFQHTYPTMALSTGNPDEYYFWDEWHYSRATHHIFGNDMYHKVLDFFSKH